MQNLPYRKTVGAIILNDKKQIFVARRTDSVNCWQMPQGGVELGESLEQALKRELLEEIGTNDVKILEFMEPLRYDFPKKIALECFNNKYQGQEITWGIVNFIKPNPKINLSYSTPQEFDAWEWVNVNNTVERVSTFKQGMYEKIAEYLKQNNWV